MNTPELRALVLILVMVILGGIMDGMDPMLK